MGIIPEEAAQFYQEYAGHENNRDWFLLDLRIQHRSQPHGASKFLFNSIYRSTLQKEPVLTVE